ncbi:hypothetical protein B0I63_004790 [Clostridium beijerinckii]|uniref:Uncharacterized protein n=1 Tax=Clostridium beijerinckii TaxID=1520 RepID=A0A9Q5CHH3_CLOBE|nr:hypothetical protein CLBIJ_45840 [Clostridium beijerinckii]MBA2883630.1 hypothetical protein [Clostridium beijerinckii]MBA2898817.1 hypothetical protein [Clostridium beijerinckii]MBA2908217.1 hypothetical protein [Clostridium beijerinckii]MBA9013234.1 hypothetical protein [Clostridium beijerinckii]
MVNVKNRIYAILELMDEIFNFLINEEKLNNKSIELI